MDLRPLVSAVWSCHLKLETLGRLTAASRGLHVLITPDLALIERRLADEFEQEALDEFHGHCRFCFHCTQHHFD